MTLVWLFIFAVIAWALWRLSRGFIRGFRTEWHQRYPDGFREELRRRYEERP